jgi:uncharacterized protein YjbI with pentapeptide repeats/dsRNA-specific ribonuclease
MAEEKLSYEFAQLSHYRFNDKRILIQALTRKSHPSAKQFGNFESLEWLGDSVLGLVIADLIKEYHPDANEGELTRLKTQLIHNKGPLARVARHLGVHQMIRCAKNETITDKKLSDHMEAILGAIFNDSKQDYPTVKRFISHHWNLLGLNEDNLSVSDYGAPSLIEAKDVKTKNQEHLTRALFKAIAEEVLEKVILLLQSGAFIEAKNPQGHTPIWAAFHLNNWRPITEHLIEEAKANLEAIDRNGLTLLHVFARDNEFTKCEYLLDQMAEVNVVDEKNNTPLHYAAANSHFEVAKILISYNANIDARNHQGMTASAIARYYQHFKLVDLLDQENEKKHAPSKALYQLIKETKCYELGHKEKEILALIHEGADLFHYPSAQDNIFRLLLNTESSSIKNILPLALSIVLPVHNVDMSNVTLTGMCFKNINFERANLASTNLSFCEFIECNFSYADLSRANIYNCKFEKVTFSHTVMQDILVEPFLQQYQCSLELTMDEYSFKSWLHVYQQKKFSCNAKLKINLVVHHKQHDHFSTRTDDIIDLRSVNLHGLSLSTLEYRGCYLRMDATALSSFLSTVQEKIALNNVDLRQQDLSQTDLTKIDWTNAVIDRTTLISLLPAIRHKKGALKNIQIVSSQSLMSSYNSGPENLDNLDLSNIDFTGARLHGASFNHTNLSNCIFVDAMLCGCQFEKAVITNINLNNATLDGLALRSLSQCASAKEGFNHTIRLSYGSNSYFDLSRLNLSGIVIQADLHWINFENTILTNSQYGYCSLEHINLRRANLSNANLFSVNKAKDCIYEETNFSGAKLNGIMLASVLAYSNLGKVNLDNINCADARITETMNFNSNNVVLNNANFNNANFSLTALLTLLPLFEKNQIVLKNIKIIEPLTVEEFKRIIPYVKVLDVPLIKLKPILTEGDFAAFISLMRCSLIPISDIEIGHKRQYYHFHQTVERLTVNNADLSHFNFTGAKIHHVTFNNSNLTGTIFRQATLQEVIFQQPIGLTPQQLAEAAAFTSCKCSDKTIMSNAHTMQNKK